LGDSCSIKKTRRDIAKDYKSETGLYRMERFKTGPPG
jgi:hypothetical protein